MTEFHTLKRIDNSRLRRRAAPARLRECVRRLALGGVLAAGGMLCAWQHFQCLQLGYQLEELKASQTEAAELNQQLRLEAASLSAPMRIDAIARHHLGLTVPGPGQLGLAAVPAETVLAQARYPAGQASQ